MEGETQIRKCTCIYKENARELGFVIAVAFRISERVVGKSCKIQDNLIECETETIVAFAYRRRHYIDREISIGCTVPATCNDYLGRKRETGACFLKPF
jgi:hypothetical protein